jgi:hypothetical protein
MNHSVQPRLGTTPCKHPCISECHRGSCATRLMGLASLPSELSGMHECGHVRSQLLMYCHRVEDNGAGVVDMRLK